MNIGKFFKSNSLFRLTIGALFIGFILLGVVAQRSAYSQIDLSISQAVQDIYSPQFSILMNVVSTIGDGVNMVIVIVLAMSLLYLTGLRVEAIITALLTASAATIGSLTKILVNRPRPGNGQVIIQDFLSDSSFPSLHVLIFTGFFGYLLYLAIYKVRSKWLKVLIAVPSAVLILFVGISRIYLGAHWASDTIGGYLLGAMFLILAIKISGKSSN